jgi:DNA-binding SARP family transcriptional activator/tetratricopeptide (TPR) repeat protein
MGGQAHPGVTRRVNSLAINLLHDVTPLRLFTLGTLRLEPPATVVLGGRRKELVLLAYLARRAPGAVRREEMAALFWESQDEARARHSLRQALHRLRQVLREGIEVDASQVRLAGGAIELDAMVFEREIAAGQLQEAVERCEGDFLQGAEEAGGESFRVWLEPEREALRRKLGWALAQLTRQAEERGAWAEAVGWAQRWAEARPAEEAGHTRLVEALRLADRPAEAAERHAAFVTWMRQEIDAEPSAAFLQLAGTRRPPAPEERGSGAAALFTPDLIGRGASFAELAAAWRTVEQGEGAVVLVEGEEGIGRTRLCQEFTRWLASREAPALRLEAAAYESDQEVSLAVARRLLAALPAAPGLAGAPDAALGELSALLPALRQRFPRLPEPTGEEAALAGALREVLCDVATEVPILLLLDDFSAADPTTRRLVLSLARDPPPFVLLLLTDRSDLLETGAPGATLRQLPSVRRIRLQPLGGTEVEALLDSMLTLVAEERQPLARALHAESGGNPLYIVELVHALAEEERLALDAEGVWKLTTPLEGESLPLPETLREAARERLARLEPGTRKVLEAAAVLGPRSEPALLEAIAGLAPTEFSAALDALLSRRLLRESEAPPGYEFSHEIVRRIGYERLSPARRQALHRAALRALQAGAAAGKAEPERVAFHRERAGAPPPRDPGRARRRWALAATLLVLLLLIPAALMLWRRGGPPPSPTTVAVLPFSLHGDPEFAYLREGIAKLLSTGLDGASGLRVVDPHVLLAAAARESGGSMDPGRGRALAARFGAGLYVLGSITAAGGQLQVSASLYRGNGELQKTVHATAVGEAGIFSLVDQLTRDLLTTLHPGTRGRLSGVAGATTASLPALKAYLDGESELRAGRFQLAAQAFGRALTEDSTFALASYRRAVAAEWLKDPRMEEESIHRAMRHRARLPERYRRLIEAYEAGYRGAADEAERLYRALLRTHPDDAVAWSRLAELLIHYNPMRGRPMGESRPAFERAVALDPTNSEALWHLAQLTTTERRSAALDSLLPQLSEGEYGAMWRLTGALLRGDSVGAGQIRAELRRAPDEQVYEAAWLVPLFTYDFREGARLATLLTAGGRPDRWRAAGEILVAHAELARGRVRATDRALRAAERLDRGAALPYRGLFAALPFLPLPEGELRSLRQEVEGWDAGAPLSNPIEHPLLDLHDTIRPQLRLYLLGLLSARLGERDTAREYAAALERSESSAEARELARDLALGIEARSALHEGRPAEALAALERAQLAPPATAVSFSPFYSQALERFTRAELLRLLGRDEEALRWYASVAESPPFGYLYLAPAHLRQGEIQERLGNRQQAIHHYVRFVELWQECDPELRPLVEQAERRLERLQAGAGS